MFHADNAYYLPAVHIGSQRLKTNTVSNTAFRGFGGPQGMLVVEHVMDQIAWATGRDPLDVRYAQFLSAGRRTSRRTAWRSRTRHAARTRRRRWSARRDYRARREEIAAFNAGSAILKRGHRADAGQVRHHFTLIHLNQAGALVHVYQDGSVHLNHGGTEMGQGLYIKVAQVVAEEFGIAVERVRITATTTAKVPNTSPTAASSGSDLNGMAARIAARAIKAAHGGLCGGAYRGRRSEQSSFATTGSSSATRACRSPSSRSNAFSPAFAVRGRASTRRRRSPGTAPRRPAVRSSTSPTARPARR